MKSNKKGLSPTQHQELLSILKARFGKNLQRHKGIDWASVGTRLNSPGLEEQLWSLNEMERTGGEPDVVNYDKKNDAYIFFDCSAESPKGRRSLCYDGDALRSRKENKPANSAVDLALSMGIELLSEDEYRYMQTLGEFDTKTSSWVQTPDTIRNLGGAFFCDRRYNHVFLYHNGAESYYAARGFRGSLTI